MRFTIAAAAALVAGAAAADYDYGYANTTSAVVDYATTVVSEYITYCPSPTEITYGDKTYTVTEATTLTITDGPYTVVHPVTTSVVYECHTCAPVETHPPAPTYYPTEEPPAPTYYPTASGPGPVYPSYTPPPSEGGASKAFAASGAGLAAVFGLVAYIL